MDYIPSQPWPIEKVYKNESGYTVTVYKAAYLSHCIRYLEEDNDEEEDATNLHGGMGDGE